MMRAHAAACLTCSSPAIPSKLFLFFNDTATTEIYTLSLHDALPISRAQRHHAVVQIELAQHLLGAGQHALMLVLADRKSTCLNSSHITISYAVFCLKKKKTRYEEKFSLV